jgi:hypothetical protein
MSCPFPGDLFVQFTKLQYLYLSYNALTVRACSSRSASPRRLAIRQHAAMQALTAGTCDAPPAPATLQGDVNEVARNLSGLGLQELGLMNNAVGGRGTAAPCIVGGGLRGAAAAPSYAPGPGGPPRQPAPTTPGRLPLVAALL